MEPRATYRIQLRPGFGFDEAEAIADYLQALGVSHVYCSPYLQAAPGSTHGYDVVDYGRVNEELGGAASHRQFCERLGQVGLGQILDIVPNHMAVVAQNPWWWDVLENGPAGHYARFFDVEWAPPEQRLHNKVLVPVLGDHYGRVLEAGEIRVRRSGSTFTIQYYEHTVPVAPRSLAMLLGQAVLRTGSSELAFLADAFDRLPLPTETDRDVTERRHRDKGVLGAWLGRLFSERPDVSDAIDAAVEALNADSDALDRFLAAQNCRLAYWRTASRDLGYRRFFDINSLVALRMEDPQVFEETHALLLAWLGSGVIDGLRVDHPDGLSDPKTYFDRLRGVEPGAWVLAEKILVGDERLPGDWAVDGTTGYDFLNRLAGIFVDPAAEESLTRFYAEEVGAEADFEAVAREAKQKTLRDMMGSDVNRLTELGLQICEQHRRFRDFTRHDVHEVLRETLANLSVYRTYVRPTAGAVSDADRVVVNEAIEKAKALRPELDGELFDFLRAILLLEVGGTLESELVTRFQQLSGPVMAKGMEDTTFYAYARFVALNEVGGAPERFGHGLELFHQSNAETLAHWPKTMLATSTHDTKRSEDVRARLWLLSENAAGWTQTVRGWMADNARHKQGELPDRNIEYLLYQTLVGAWPIDRQRMEAYVLKAAREAKTHTSWTVSNPAYEEALSAFVAALFDDAAFLRSVEKVVAPLVAPGRQNSLAQTLIKLTAPGVPDIYQGNELWDLSLVDPDNRRPVDFELRRRLLAELGSLRPEAVLARSDEGLPKLWVTVRTLALRNRHPEWFDARGSYSPLQARGEKAAHLVGFSRAQNAVTVAPRWPVRLGGRWADTRVALPAGRFENVLTGETVAGPMVEAAQLFQRFPVALLAREEDLLT